MILTLYVKPNARENKIIQWVDEDTLKLSVTATPEKGQANKAVIELLAKSWKIPKSVIHITRGLSTKIKQVKIPNEYKAKIDILSHS